MSLRHAPGAERQEDGEHDRELLGQHRHGGRDAGEEALQPVVPRVRPYTTTTTAAATRPTDGDDPNEAVDLALQRRALGFDGAQRGADATELGAGARRLGERRDAAALDHERAGEHPRCRVAARRAHRLSGGAGATGALRTGTDSPVSADSSTERLTQSTSTRVGGHAIALGEQHDVAPHDVAAGDPLLRPSRTTSARGDDRSRSAASAFSVLCSW